MESRTCEYCGKVFNGTKNRRYCSDECAVLGAKRKREIYLKSHPERLEKQREYNRAHRQKLKEAEAAIDQKHVDDIRLSISIDDSVNDLKEKAEAGDMDARCRMEILQNGKTSLSYWTAYKEKELPLCEQGHNIRLVNGISVYDDLFAEKVIDSISELKVIRSELIKGI